MNSRDEQPEGPEGEAPNADDTIGYKRPPKQYQFPKGRSGNPAGRRRGARGRRAIVQRVLLERRRVEIDGRARELTMLELVVLALRQEALNCKARASKVYENLEGFCGLKEPEAPDVGCLVIPHLETREQWTALWGPDGIASKMQAEADR